MALDLARQVESEAKKQRIEAEEAILKHQDVSKILKCEGTVRYAEGFSIVTGYTRHWDQASLSELKTDIKEDYWPFKTEYKEVRSQSRFIEEKFKDLWRILARALTLTEKKPVIKLLDKK